MYKLLHFFSFFFLIVITGVSGVTRAQNISPPAPFEAEYSLYTKGTKVARVNRRLVKLDDDRYEYRSETRTTGLAALISKVRIIETSILIFQGEVLRSEYYSYARSGDKKKRDVSIEFNRQTKKIKNTLNGDFWPMPTAPTVMDKLLYQLAIMHDLKNGRTPVSYLIADRKGIKTYNFEKLGEEIVKTPLGNYNSIKILRHKPGSNRKSIFWCAPELDFLPIKVEHTEKDGSTTRAVIKSLQGINPHFPPGDAG